MLAERDGGPESGGDSVVRDVPWGVRDVFAVIGLVIVVFFLLLIPLASLSLFDGVENGTQVTAVTLVFTLIIDLALLGLTLRFTVFKYRSGWSQLGFRLPRLSGSWWMPFVFVLGSYVVLLVYVAIVEALGFDQAIPESTLPEDTMDDPLIMALIGLLAVVVAPVTEETFFRGFMFSALRKRWGFIVAAVASGLLFALAHTDFGSIIPFTVIGVFLAAIYTYTGSLWVSIASHLLFNFISFLAAAITGGAG